MSPIPANHPDSLTTALAFAEYGFGVFSVWGIKDGACLCPKGKACPDSPGKHPIPVNGFKAASLDPARITTMLRAAGSAGNYGVCPAENTIIIDVDGEGWREKLAALGLPKTLAVLTANGIHLYFYWPSEHGPAPSHLFGWKVRSLAHMGYVVGPGSTHQSGVRYRFAHQNGHTNEDMVATIKPFPKALVPPDKKPTLGLVGNATITVGGAVEPETIQEGGRYDYLRDKARPLWGIGLSGEDLFKAVDAFNQRFPIPHDRATVERAIDEERLNRNFQRDSYTPPVVIPTTGLFVNVTDYHAAQPTSVEWVSPLMAYGFVSLIAGPPKAGKSTLVGNLLSAREAGTTFLWGNPVPQGPMALVTEEGGLAVVRKTQGLTTLDILDRKNFYAQGLRKLEHLLDALTQWCGSRERALVLIDTLAIWGDIKDENDATAATQAVAALTLLTQQTQCAMGLIHHARKGGGDHGEGIRGSGAIFATVDQAIELNYVTDKNSDNRLLTLSGRLIFPEMHELSFDRGTNTYEETTSTYVDPSPLDKFPTSTSGLPGVTRKEAEGIWEVSTSEANKRLRELVAKGRLAASSVKGPEGWRNEYHRVILLDLSADTRSVGERMADLFHDE